ncbi:MAG: Fic family protein [Acidobacteriota bacterium]
MPDWEQDSAQLRRNLKGVAKAVKASAQSRERPTLDLIRQWHKALMEGLEAPKSFEEKRWRGQFRGERELENVRVRVGALEGVSPERVHEALETFAQKFKQAIDLLDRTVGLGPQTPEQLRLVLQTAAWVHAEWVRIHPFVNGNGRTARLWANWVLMRFGLPPFLRLRPRPAGEVYATAGREAMKGNWEPTLRAFEAMLP